MANILVSGAILLLIGLVAYPNVEGREFVSRLYITRQRLNFLFLHSPFLSISSVLEKSCSHHTSV